jgi:hypothetical protein
LFLLLFLSKVYIIFFYMFCIKVLIMGRFRKVGSVSEAIPEEHAIDEADFNDDAQPSIDDAYGGKFDFDKEVGWGRYGDVVLVGNGEVTNPDTCGKFARLVGCVRVDLHNLVLDYEFHGKVYVRKVFLSCDKPSCPVCMRKGWAVKEAQRIEHRIKEASLRFGLAEHIILSVPVSDYGLSWKAMLRKAVKIAKSRGIVGGCFIPHGFRYRSYAHTRNGIFHDKGWFYSPHVHVIGFVLDGYAKCRNCKNRICRRDADGEHYDLCNGFEARTRKLSKKDGWLVKVLGKRISIWGTAFYQLSHASYEEGHKHDVVTRWFGCCSYRKLKVTKDVRKELCPICSSEIGEIAYVGVHPELLSGERKAFEDYYEDGRVAWVGVRRRKGIAGARFKPSDFAHPIGQDVIDELFSENGCSLPKRVNY